MNPTTEIRDSILATVSPNVDADDVLAGVEWAALDDTRRAAYAGRFPDWATVDPANWRAAR